MADRILRVKDAAGTVHDIGFEVVDLGRHGIITYAHIPDNVNRELGKISVKDLATLATETTLVSTRDHAQTVALRIGDITVPAAGTVNARLEQIRALLAAEDFATQTTLDSVLAELQTQQKNALTNTELRATPVPVSGTLAVNNHPSDFPDSGSHTRLDSLIAEVDGLEEAIGTTADLDTAMTVVGRLKAILAELQTQQKNALTNTELRASDIQVNDDTAQTIIQNVVDALGNTTTVNTVRELLLRIHGAVDGLEVSVGDIDLNTDQLESKLDTLNAKDFATQATLAAVLAQLDDATTDTVLSVLKAIDANLNVDLSTRASEATVSTLLTEATFTAEDFATETTLNTVLTRLQEIEDRIQGLENTTPSTIRSRLMNKWVQSGWVPWVDLNNTTYLYVGEAPLGTAGSAAAFNIIRVPITSGGPTELVQNAVWDNRTTLTGWAS